MGEAIFVHEIGGPEVLRLEAADPGEPGPGAVRIRVTAAGVNFIDVYFRSGGLSAAHALRMRPRGRWGGRIRRRPASTGTRAGRSRRMGGSSGLLRDATSSPPPTAWSPCPRPVSDTLAAAAMLQGMTAHYLVHGCRETRPGDVARRARRRRRCRPAVGADC